jgi:hypothetical protein
MTIYFIRKGLDGPIKIGYTSSSAKNRMSQLQTGHHENLYLLGTIPGTISEEKFLHKELIYYNINGEWFDPKPELLMVISDAIENQKEWYYFRQVRFNKIDIECKGLNISIFELNNKIKTLEEEKQLIIDVQLVNEKIIKRLERTNLKLVKRIHILTARNSLTKE